MLSPVTKEILIVGGTHGDELHGVFLINNFDTHFDIPSEINVYKELANPKAVELCKRYVDQNLNSSFANLTIDNYECKRAEFLTQKWKSKIDLVLDFHNTNSNVGLSLVFLNKDVLLNEKMLNIASELTSKFPEINIIVFNLPTAKLNSFLVSLAPLHIVFEVGPVVDGTLNSELYFKTIQIISYLFNFLAESSPKKSIKLFDYYEVTDSFSYPLNEDHNTLSGLLHPSLHHKDFQLVNPGDKLFIGFDGNEITYAGEDSFYPIFINSSAYFQQNRAFFCAKKRSLNE